jgi:dTDP-4-dehydrorhamnose 3,5-epimerase-like enzyme
VSAPPKERGEGVIELRNLGDERGSLVALEAKRQVPFEIRRVFFVVGVPAGYSRGYHAHRTLQQMAVAVTGGVTMDMDDGNKRWQVRLDRPDRALLIPPLVWHTMHDFTPECALLVLASAEYDERDYIRDRAEFDRIWR